MFYGLKWGAGFNLYNYTSFISPSIMHLISMSYATSTWSSYQTAWLCFCTFCIHSNTRAILPVPVNTILKYIDYLLKWKKLQHSTISGYLSALKVLHFLNGHPFKLVDSNFTNYLVEHALQGAKNSCKLNNKPANPRRVMSFPAMQLLGHGLASQGFCDFDTQLIWTCCTLAFWGSFRMSELLASGNGTKISHTCNALTWERVFKPNSNQLTISVKFPKVMKHSKADAVDVYRYLDTKFCPVFQLLTLRNLMQDSNTFKPSDLIFRLASGKLLTMTVMNKILRNTMALFFDGNHSFSCHSFRAGLPSTMASLPEYFNETEIKIVGRWDSDTYLRYTRFTGIARELSMNKVHKVLNERYFLNIYICIHISYIHAHISFIFIIKLH